MFPDTPNSVVEEEPIVAVVDTEDASSLLLALDNEVSHMVSVWWIKTGSHYNLCGGVLPVFNMGIVIIFILVSRMCQRCVLL